MNHDLLHWIPLLINSINLKRDGVRICLGKDVGRCIFEGLLTPSCFRDGIIYIEIFMWNMARSSGVGGVEMHWWMLRGWCCIAVATLEPMNRDSRCRMSALRFHFWGRKIAWNQASLVRASSVPDLYVYLLNKQNVDMVFVLCLGPPTRLILRFCGPIFGTARRSQKWDREHAFLWFLY